MKFRNVKKKKPTRGKKVKSPKNSRPITELFKFSFPTLNPDQLFVVYRRSLKGFTVFIFLAAVVIVGLDLQQNIKAAGNIDAQRADLVVQRKFWDDFLEKNKNYRDAYLQASIVEYRLGYEQKAREYVKIALFLDPNSQSAREIEEFLSK